MQVNLKRVMIIDDNEIDLKINSKIIEIAKLFEEIVVCNSGQEALDYFQKHMHHDEQLPNFILLDIQMPEMNGFDFLDRFDQLPEKIKKNCQIAMLSSTLDFGDIQRAEANLYVLKLLKKPLQPNELKHLLHA